MTEFDKVSSETWIASPKRPVSQANACLVHIYPTGANIGRRYALAQAQINLGRGEECDIRITDHSVSRRHARIECSPSGILLSDLDSTNGTFVNDRSITSTVLQDGDYVRVGNCIYRYLSGGNIETDYHEEIYRLTIIDGLTQVHNQRYLNEFLDREFVRSVRHNRPLSFVLFDIDHFKAINDELGHLGGDFVLRELANRIRHVVRREDLLARYGGEEFGVVLVETAHAQALEVAERIRRMIEADSFTFDNRTVKITISAGISTGPAGPELGVNDLVRLADERMYAAKREGRNRVCGEARTEPASKDR
jgi:diguanylate cyclase (GGDEF)-like protein